MPTPLIQVDYHLANVSTGNPNIQPVYMVSLMPQGTALNLPCWGPKEKADLAGVVIITKQPVSKPSREQRSNALPKWRFRS